jgi:4-amino-4-deoxy-L-arabinose transferase-like glycosyltransferase
MSDKHSGSVSGPSGAEDIHSVSNNGIEASGSSRIELDEQSKLAFVLRILETQLNYLMHYDSRCNYLITFFIGFITVLAVLIAQTDIALLRILFAVVVLMGVSGICLSLIAVAPFSRHPKDVGFTLKVNDQRFQDVTFYQGIRQYNSVEKYIEAVKNKCSGDIDSLISEFSSQSYIVSGILKRKVEFIALSNYLAVGVTILGSVIVLLTLMLG